MGLGTAERARARRGAGAARRAPRCCSCGSIAARVAERAATEAQAAALRAADGVRTPDRRARGRRSRTRTTNPRLVAALDANVDQETLRDLLLTEPWWEPFRRAVDGFGLYSDETTAVVTSQLPARLRGAQPWCATRARRTGRRPGWCWPAGRCWRVAACPIALTGRADWPVLVATEVLDVGLLSGIAERAGAAVAISDGRRLLVAAPAGAAAAGADDRASPRSSRRSTCRCPAVGRSATSTVATLPLAGGLRVLVGVAAPATADGRRCRCPGRCSRS